MLSSTLNPSIQLGLLVSCIISVSRAADTDVGSATSRYMGASFFEKFGLICFSMSSASLYVSAKHVQELGPRFVF